MKLLTNHWYLIDIDGKQHVAKYEPVPLGMDLRFSTFIAANNMKIFAYDVNTKPRSNIPLGNNLRQIKQNFPEYFI